MAADILSINALHRKTADNRKKRKVQLALRDSAIAQHAATAVALDSYTAVIAGLDSDIQNFVSSFDYMDSHHLYWNNNDHYDIGNYYAFKCGIKRLCNYGSITNNFAVVNTSGSHLQCGQSCTFTVPAGVTRMGITGTAPGGPTPGANCCGGNFGGPYGSFISTILCVTQGDQFLFCSGCSFCCFYYCCGYQLCCSHPSWMCVTGGTTFTAGDKICLRSPNPYKCVEMKNRGYDAFARCGSQLAYNDGYNSCVRGGGCCCHTYWMGICMCGECGNSICNEGNNRGCIYFGCRSENVAQGYGRCLSGVYFQCDLYGTEGCHNCCCDNNPSGTQCRNAIFMCTNICNKQVQGSCFPWWGGWPGGWHCNNCYTAWHPNHPYGLAVGVQTSNCEVNHCMTQCCPSCLCKACCNQRCFPGYGGYSGMMCGGSTGYQDMGRHGAWCIQYC